MERIETSDLPHMDSDQSDIPKELGTTAVHNHRLVSKKGKCLVKNKVSSKERMHGYTRDLFTTLVDMKWRYHFLIWSGSLFATWIGYGFLWYAAIVNQEPEVEGQSNRTELTVVETDHSGCVGQTYSLVESILFSFESQTTVGYGAKYLRTGCNPGAYVLYYIQVLSGVFIPCFLGGLIFAKSKRPKRRSETIAFSRIAVINRAELPSGNAEQPSGIAELFFRLQFRVGNIRKSHIIGTSMRVLMVKDRYTSEGEQIPFCQFPLEIKTQSGLGDSFVFIPWPITVEHTIDRSSPLWGITEDSLRTDHFEIIVIFEGVVESTGKPTQFRSSYLPKEINWGHRFVPLEVTTRKSIFRGLMTEVDFSNFDKSVPVLAHAANSDE